MGRLIDADALIEEYPQASGLKLVVENAPTAYDVEKVVAELEEESYSTTDIVCGGRFDAIRLNSAIGIVKRGGVE